MSKSKRCGLIFAPMPYGNRFVSVGVCCTLGCTEPHYLGGMDPERRPKRTYESATKAWQASNKANLREAERTTREINEANLCQAERATQIISERTRR